MQRTTKQIEEQLRIERIARKEFRKMKSLLKEDAGVKEAFLDVFRALRLAAMDISNSLRLAIGVIFTFDPEKMDKLIKDFDTRRQKINAEWEPILQRAQEAFNNADPILTMAIMGPANFLAMQGMGAGLTAGKTVIEILAAKNWNELIDSFTTTLDVNQSLQQFFQEYSSNEERRQERDAQALETMRTGRGRGVISRLSDVFSEGYEYKVGVLREQTETTTPSGMTFTEDQAIELLIKATGMDKSFEKIRKANLENLKSTILEVKSSIEPLRSSSKLFAAKDLPSFESAFKEVKSKNPQVDVKSFDNFMNTISTETKKLSKDPKFREELTKKKPGTSLSEQQIESEAKKSVFQITKKEFDKQLSDGLSKAVKASDDAIKKLKIDDSVLKYMKDSPYQDSKEVAKVYEDFLAVYKEIKNDFESKAVK